jgi:hypothetical protein
MNSDKFQIINDIVWAALETEGKGWKQIFKVCPSSLGSFLKSFLPLLMHQCPSHLS